MQIPRRAGNDDFGECKAAQHGGDGWRCRVPLARVANEREVGFEFVSVGVEERRQARRAALFFAFQQNGHRHGQGTCYGHPSSASLDKRHELTLIV